MNELAFAAGIMVGEGCITNATRPTSDGRRQVQFSVSMLDHRAVERVAAAISPHLPAWSTFTDCPVSYQEHKRGGTYARIHLGGKRAEAACRVLYPYMVGTLKGAQMEQAFMHARLDALDPNFMQ